MNDSSPKQETPYGLRMPPDLKARVKAAAEANNRSMNAEIVATLMEKYPEPAFSLDNFWATWVQPALAATTKEERQSIVDEAEELLRDQAPELSIWLNFQSSPQGDVCVGSRAIRARPHHRVSSPSDT